MSKLSEVMRPLPSQALGHEAEYDRERPEHQSGNQKLGNWKDADLGDQCLKKGEEEPADQQLRKVEPRAHGQGFDFAISAGDAPRRKNRSDQRDVEQEFKAGGEFDEGQVTA